MAAASKLLQEEKAEAPNGCSNQPRTALNNHGNNTKSKRLQQLNDCGNAATETAQQWDGNAATATAQREQMTEATKFLQGQWDDCGNEVTMRANDTNAATKWQQGQPQDRSNQTTVATKQPQEQNGHGNDAAIR